jgi:hypothetical protein
MSAVRRAGTDRWQLCSRSRNSASAYTCSCAAFNAPERSSFFTCQDPQLSVSPVECTGKVELARVTIGVS